MPYTNSHKANTRNKIVAAARGLFNRHGFEQVSIDRIMASAGLTRGGFYNHFDSKDQLYAEAVASFSSCNPFRTYPSRWGEADSDGRQARARREEAAWLAMQRRATLPPLSGRGSSDSRLLG